MTRNTTVAAAALGVPGVCLSVSMLLKTKGVILS